MFTHVFADGVGSLYNRHTEYIHAHAPICQCQVHGKDNITSADTYGVSHISPSLK